MKTLEYHYKIINNNDVIFQFPYGRDHLYPYCNFGDQIAILNMHVYFNTKFNLNGKLSVFNLSNLDELYLSNLFFNNITSDPPNYLLNLPSHGIVNDTIFDEIYKNEYVKIKNLNRIKINKYVSYSYDAVSYVDEKVPIFFKKGIEQIKNKYKNYQFVEVGKNVGLVETLKYIDESILFITVDSGLAHLCRCTNTPYIILKKQGWNESRCFPPTHCKYVSYDSYEDMINIIL